MAECTGDNLFIVKQGKMSTPPLSAGALYGITRGVVMEFSRDVVVELDMILSPGDLR